MFGNVMPVHLGVMKEHLLANLEVANTQFSHGLHWDKLPLMSLTYTVAFSRLFTVLPKEWIDFKLGAEYNEDMSLFQLYAKELYNW